MDRHCGARRRLARMELFTTRPGGDALALTVWGSLSSWTLTALPLFIWMGEILLKTRLSEGMFRGLAPWLQWLPGPAAAHQHHRLHDLRGGIRLVGGHLRHGRQDHAAGTQEARLPRADLDRFARRRRHAGAADPSVDHHDRLRRGGRRFDRQAVHRGRDSGPDACGLFMGYTIFWAAAQSRPSASRRHPARASRRSSPSRAT